LKAPKFSFFTAIYFFIVVVILAVEYAGLWWAYYLTKPLPLILIFIFYKMNSGSIKGSSFRNLMLTAFLFCDAGDTLLMFTNRGEQFFIAGLLAFLTGHILYTSAFFTEITKIRPWRQHWAQLAFSALLVVYGAEFYILNRFSFGSLWLPVMVYCMAITAMGVAATMRDLNHSKIPYLKVVAGAVLFIVSDSLLATNKFIVQFELAGLLVLSTYFIGQYLIATGSLESLVIRSDNSAPATLTVTH